MENSLPPIPAKRYFTISEVSNLCGVKPHVLRYWEQEFTQLSPMKRRGNRRYYQRHEVELIRQIRQLLHEQGFTIMGARNKLQEFLLSTSGGRIYSDAMPSQSTLQSNQHGNSLVQSNSGNRTMDPIPLIDGAGVRNTSIAQPFLTVVRLELINIRELLGPIG